MQLSWDGGVGGGGLGSVCGGGWWLGGGGGGSGRESTCSASIDQIHAFRFSLFLYRAVFI